MRPVWIIMWQWPKFRVIKVQSGFDISFYLINISQFDTLRWTKMRNLHILSDSGDHKHAPMSYKHWYEITEHINISENIKILFYSQWLLPKCQLYCIVQFWHAFCSHKVVTLKFFTVMKFFFNMPKSSKNVIYAR